MTTFQLLQYYASLLILQYLGKPKAYATVQVLAAPALIAQTSTQTVSLSLVPSSGTFVLSYKGVSSAAINWNDSVGTIQTKLQAITGLASATVSGSLAAKLLTVTFTDVAPPAQSLAVVSSSLVSSGTAIVLTINETDITLPLAVQGGFNLIAGTGTAVGNQLDVLGKYAGVTRSGNGFTGPITLNDADFLNLIYVAIARNSAGSSLATIQALIAQYFPGEMLVFDYQNMQMSYLISSAVGSINLVQLFVTEGLLPRPMAVSLSVIYAPIINTFFGFRTYALPAVNSTPFNTYSSYQTNRPWLSYANGVSP